MLSVMHIYNYDTNICLLFLIVAIAIYFVGYSKPLSS